MTPSSDEPQLDAPRDVASKRHLPFRNSEDVQSASGPALPPAGLPIVAIGASAGGLEAITRLLKLLPAKSGMAFIFVQHLDPTHESMMVELLSEHSAMPVVQAIDGAMLAPDHVYIIPPGRYLSVRSRVLYLSTPEARHGARLPFDFLIKSLAQDCAPLVAAVILTGTGTDGSLGIAMLKANGGMVIVQDPDEAEYDGMPRSAIETGQVDSVLPLDRIAGGLQAFARKLAVHPPEQKGATPAPTNADLSDIIVFLQKKTGHDFRLYKPGTMQRRIERRMGMLAMPTDHLPDYLTVLRDNAEECDLLAKDLLINVTSFFRDRKVFDLLETEVLPPLIRSLPDNQPLRIWVAGCSTGEEAYSLAMICNDAIQASKRNIKLQIFASDVDADAIAVAREGFYPDTIAEQVPADRLARHFVKEEGGGYRIAPSLRGDLVFTVQDVLVDPPFSRIDLVSCRNLLIYLNAEAQARVISLFHFALREGGILVLGSSETIGKASGRFGLISKAESVYRHIVSGRTGDQAIPFSFGARIPAIEDAIKNPSPARQTTLAELCRKAVLENYAPASVLIDANRQCLYSIGPVSRYLRVTAGYASLDLLAMATPSLRTKLKVAIEQVNSAVPKVTAGRSRAKDNGKTIWFTIEVQHLMHQGEPLVLVSFVEEDAAGGVSGQDLSAVEAARISDLEHELDAVQSELQIALQHEETKAQEHKAINEEALSVNEEFQSTNEELLTSKEELQSLNEELKALNSQLQETLDRQRTTADDLQNVLYSTNVATLFLDGDLKIRFFTPATKALFNVIQSDINRPLSDLRSMANDESLLTDAQAVLTGKEVASREITTPDGTWFTRGIFPYRAHDEKIEGVVITFADISERKAIAKALEAAKREAERANLAKSHFLAAASHDLRQPLQSMILLESLLAQTVESDEAKELVVRLDQTLGAMTGMLNALLDINQIEAGNIECKPVPLRLDELMVRLGHEFEYLANAKSLKLRILPSHALVMSDPILLEQMIRNLLSNAVKYTLHGKILMGCRRQGNSVRLEVWDTGIGIADKNLRLIFDEFHQVSNAARERNLGVGLGLAIVERLGAMLGHEVRVRSEPGKGSVFSIVIGRVDETSEGTLKDVHEHRSDSPSGTGSGSNQPVGARQGGKILLVEDDPDVMELLQLVLAREGHDVMWARDGAGALAAVTKQGFAPDLVLTDYRLPGGMNGLEMLAELRKNTPDRLPAILLSGDISIVGASGIDTGDSVLLGKPVRPPELIDTIAALRAPIAVNPAETVDAVVQVDPINDGAAPIVFIIDDDHEICLSLEALFASDGLQARSFASAEEFLARYKKGTQGCALIDAYLPGLSGLALLEQLRRDGDPLPAIIITGNGDVGLAVEAMKKGANDFIEKPVDHERLLECIDRALQQSADITLAGAEREEAEKRLATLTNRQREIMDLVLCGHPSKNIAADLRISQRTVENHRAAIMQKMGAKSMPELVRIVLSTSHGEVGC